MSSRVFQSIVLQMKECTDRVIGVIDDQGTVVSCNQLTWIGEKWEGAASALNVNESAVVDLRGQDLQTVGQPGVPLRLCRLCPGQ